MATIPGSKRLLDISGNNISTAVSLAALGTLLDANGQAGASNQILSSTSTGVTWVDGSGSSIIGGPYLPLAGGTLTGASTFAAQAFSAATSSGDASSTLTTKGYVDGLITGATIYRGAWDPSGGGYGSPDLSGVTQTSGYYYICSAAGAAEPNGTGTEPDTWAVGDWVIYNDVSGTGQWQKIDNSSVLSGVGTGQTVALWEGTGSVTDSDTLGNAPITVSGNNATFAGDVNIAGLTTSDGFRTDTTNSNFSLISRDSAGNSPLYVQSANTSTGQLIAKFNYGSATANSGTNVLTVAKDNSYFLNTNVGIGTTTPSQKLHIQDSSGANIILNSATGAVKNGIYMTEGTTSTPEQVGAYVYYDGSSNKFNIATGIGSPTDKLTILRDSGNVGIGTTSPAEKLTVSGNSNITGKLAIGSASAHPTYDFYNQNTSYFNGAVTLDNTFTQTGGGISSFSGNVGIGTTSPVAPLTVSGDTTQIRLENTATGGRSWALRTFGSALGIYDHTAGAFRQYIDALGNVGIGTTSPSAKFHVVGTGVVATDQPTMQSQSVLTVKPIAASSGNLNFASINAGAGIGLQYTNGPGNANWDISLQPFGGNVGIGTTSPDAKLNITAGDNGAALLLEAENSINLWKNITFKTYVSESQAANFSAGSHIYTTSPGGATTWPFTEYGALVIEGRDDGNSGIALRTGNGSGQITRIAIRESGNVGIGTTSPNRKLQVAGSFAITDSSDTSSVLIIPSTSVNNIYSRESQGANSSTPLAVRMDTSEVFRITSTGQVKFNNYTSATSFTGTAVASLAVDSSGNIITEAAGGGGGGASTITTNSFSGNGTVGPFTLGATPSGGSTSFVDVFIDGVYQEIANYTVSGTALSFVTGSEPPTGTNIQTKTTSGAVSGALVSSVDIGQSTSTTGNVNLRIIPNYITSSITAQANNLYIFDSTTQAYTLTLPSSPQPGDSIKISIRGGLATNVLAVPATENIMGGVLGVSLLINNANAAFEIIYSGDSTKQGWVIIGNV